MKRTCALLLALAMVLSLAACGGTTADNTAPRQRHARPPERGPGHGDPRPRERRNPPACPPRCSSSTLSLTRPWKSRSAPCPRTYGDVKVGAVIISLTNAFWANMKDLL